MNGENNKLAFADWASGAGRPIPQCNPAVACNVAHTSPPQDELLMRTKAQWEKQQQAAAAAAAAMCYWGYSEPNSLMFTKNDWRQMNTDRTNPSNHPPATTATTIDNGQIHIPRCIDQTAHTSKAVREPRMGAHAREGGSGKKRSRAAPVAAPSHGPQCVSPAETAGSSMSKPFPCTDCCKSFRQHSQLMTHQRTHTGDRPYLCTDCPKAFRTQGTLAIHRRIHTGEKPYSCEECGRAFRTQGTLVIHRRTHSGDRPYKCQDCGKAFAARCSLVVHWRTHTGEKPYMCTECGKLFASRSDSARHTRTHQPGANGKKPYIRRIIQQHPALQ